MDALKDFSIGNGLKYKGRVLPSKNGYFFADAKYPGKVGLRAFFDPRDLPRVADALRLSGVCEHVVLLDCEVA